MNQNSRLPIEITVVHYPGQKVLRLRFHRDAVPNWCLGLCLLKEGLVEAFTVIEQGTKGAKAKFSVGSHLGARSYVTLGAQSSLVMMTRNNLDYVYDFFLKYYRDGVADVDHLDLEATTESGDEVYITFQVPESKVPLSPAEAKKRLEDWS